MISEVVTSLHGIPSRQSLMGEEVGPAWYESCKTSWFKLSDRVISVSERSPEIDNIHWLQTDSRPSMAAIIRSMNPETGSHSLFCNGDILIGDDFIASLGMIDSNALYIAHRVDVALKSSSSNQCSVKEIYQYGLDAFVFPKALIDLIKTQNIFPEDFKIGQPWWDYALPILATYAEIPIYLIDSKPPTVLHHLHPTLNWNEDSWLSLGLVFIKFCEDLQKTAPKKAAYFISQILSAYHQTTGSQTSKLNAVSKKFKSLIGKLPTTTKQNQLQKIWRQVFFCTKTVNLNKPT